MQDVQLDFSGGVDSNVVTTIASELNPNGLKRNELAWLVNGTVRGGGLAPRNGWNYLCTVHDGSLQYQGGWLYDATALGGNPYLMLSLGGRIFQVRVDTDNSVHDVTGPNQNPTNVPQAWFGQAEQFMVIQAGDFGLVPSPALPLFWDGNSLRRSNGLTNRTTYPNISELPAATCMVYYMGRLWYAQGRLFIAGDIVFDGSSGTNVPPTNYGFTDSVLKTTENPLSLQGDGFAVPAQAGNVRALAYPISLDTTLGQGPLFAFTRNQIYALTVPVSRQDWITSGTVTPRLAVIGNALGTTSDRSVVAINSDLWFTTVTPSIASYINATRYFGQWQNSPLSNNMNRLLSSQNRALMNVTSGVNFGNRMYMTAQPRTLPVGTGFDAIAVMDFEPISSLQNQRPPAWEGSAELGWKPLQLFTGDYGGLQRMFGVVYSELDGTIQVWENVEGQQSDNNKFGESRITMISEHPAFTAGDEDQFKRLDTCHLWYDDISGNVVVQVDFRPDGDGCWHPWATFLMCSARNTQEAGSPKYPVLQFCSQDRRPVVLPKAPEFDCNLSNQRPINLGFQFQIRLTQKGFARLRSIRPFFFQIERNPYQGIIC